MQPSADQNKILLNTILDMSSRELKAYLETLNLEQKAYVKNLLLLKARPEPICDLFDRDASFTKWIMSHFYVPELNGPIWLADYQIRALNKATSKNSEGLYNYSLIAWMDIKKSIKSCIAAAVALRMAFMREWASIKVVANKREQAASRSYFYITRSLKINPLTRKLLDAEDIKINNYTISFRFNNSTIKAIPLNPEGEAGGNDDLIIWTEAWAAKTKAAQKMYTEMVIPPNKFARGFKWLESYAGFEGESPILEPIHKENVKEEFRIDDTPMYVNGRTFVLCNHAPQLPWQTAEYYEQQRVELTDSEFNRVHRNIWQSATQKFIDDVAIEQCKQSLPSLKRKERVVVAVDAAYAGEGDYFAISVLSRHPTDKTIKVAQRTSRVWRAKKNKQLKFKDAHNPENTQYPYGFLLNMCTTYKVICIVYDPYQLHSLANELKQKRVAWMLEFGQGKPRIEADNDYYKLIRDREIAINDDIVIQHTKNASSDSKGRLVKTNKKKKIDAAVATSMGAHVLNSGRIRM